MTTSVERSLWSRTAALGSRWRSLPFWRSDSAQGLLSLVDQGIVSGANFLTAVIIARCGTSQTLGAYFLAWNVFTIVQAVQGDLVLSPYIVLGRNRSGRDAVRYTGSSFAHHLILVGTSCLLMVLALNLLGRNAGQDLQGLQEASLAFLAAMPFLLTRQFIRNLGIARLRLGAMTVVDGGIAAFQVVALLILGVCGTLTVSKAYIVLGLACGLPSLVWLCSRAEPMRFAPGLIRTHWLENWSFGRWALASQLAGRATGYLLPWTLALVHGEATTGLLAACVTLVNMGGTFITGVSNFLTPRATAAYVEGGIEELLRVLRTVAAIYLGVVGVFVVVLLLFGGHISWIVYGPHYAGNENVIRWLALALLLSSLTITVGNGLWAMRRPEANFSADFCGMLAGLLVLATTVQAWGATGAALALCVGNFVGLAVRWTKFRAYIAELRVEGTGS